MKQRFTNRELRGLLIFVSIPLIVCTVMLIKQSLDEPYVPASVVEEAETVQPTDSTEVATKDKKTSETKKSKKVAKKSTDSERDFLNEHINE